MPHPVSHPGAAAAAGAAPPASSFFNMHTSAAGVPMPAAAPPHVAAMAPRTVLPPLVAPHHAAQGHGHHHQGHHQGHLHVPQVAAVQQPVHHPAHSAPMLFAPPMHGVHMPVPSAGAAALPIPALALAAQAPASASSSSYSTASTFAPSSASASASLAHPVGPGVAAMAGAGAAPPPPPPPPPPAFQSSPDASRGFDSLHQLLVELQTMVEVERRRPDVDPAYTTTTQSGNMLPEWRGRLVRWMKEVAVEFKYSATTVASAVRLLDRFLSVCNVETSELQLLALVSMYIASKLHESHPMPMRTIDAMFRLVCTVHDVRRGEVVVSDALQWDMHTVTAVDFVGHITALIKDQALAEAVRAKAIEVVLMSLEDMDMLQHGPSCVAVCAVACGFQLLQASPRAFFTFLAACRVNIPVKEAVVFKLFSMYFTAHPDDPRCQSAAAAPTAEVSPVNLSELRLPAPAASAPAASAPAASAASAPVPAAVHNDVVSVAHPVQQLPQSAAPGTMIKLGGARDNDAGTPGTGATGGIDH